MGYTDMDVDTGENSKYMRLKAGDIVQFHILSAEPKKIVIHGFGKERADCAGKSCVLCQEGSKPKKRWVIKVLDRRSNEVRIFEFGSQIAAQIKNIAEILAENQQTVNDIDFRIKREGTGELDTEYFVNQVPCKVPVPAALLETESVPF